ncbi:MAG: hypothetical protein PHU23_19535 [Dehalococcoidales bacterium]|nr:hypothetical protein [Dehalococcoidales bacterium]
MRKLFFVSIGAIVVIIGLVAYYFYLQGIDTRYAIKHSQVFGSYDINQVDKYLNEETVISYNGVSKSYKELRENVINAFENKEFKMVEDSSYGHGNNRFIDGVQEVNIQSWVDYNNKSIEVPIVMRLEIKGINKFSVKSLSSNNDFFGYLFFGIVK